MGQPYETEREAREAARHVTAGPPASWPHGSHRLIEDACTAAGVQVGAYDHRIIEWLAGWEPATCAVVAGLIARAAEGGQRLPQLDGWAPVAAQALADAIAYRQARRDPDSVDQAGLYRAFGRHLGVEAARPAGVDSESWTCRGCGGPFIGHRPPGDLCRDCSLGGWPVPGGAR